jgi:hypothetical protein
MMLVIVGTPTLADDAMAPFSPKQRCELRANDDEHKN